MGEGGGGGGGGACAVGTCGSMHVRIMLAHNLCIII